MGYLSRALAHCAESRSRSEGWGHKASSCSRGDALPPLQAGTPLRDPAPASSRAPARRRLKRAPPPTPPAPGGRSAAPGSVGAVGLCLTTYQVAGLLGLGASGTSVATGQVRGWRCSPASVSGIHRIRAGLCAFTRGLLGSPLGTPRDLRIKCDTKSLYLSRIPPSLNRTSGFFGSVDADHPQDPVQVPGKGAWAAGVTRLRQDPE